MSEREGRASGREFPQYQVLMQRQYPDLTRKNPNRLKEKLRGRFGKESTPNWSSYCLSASLMDEKYRSRKKIFPNK